ncbi:MAG: sigma-54-dependent Fis family transcriptional regulator [Nitrospirae bacterium]|nr:sigma-54-dependent Fis family transcriptional regulator [Nitrospirota bacterium]
MAERILVVDDEKSICDALAHVLKKAGCTVTTAFSGVEGIKLIESMGFDLVISDIKMEGVSGLDVLRRSLEVSPDMPVIMITAFGSIDSAVEAVRLGAADYITKPFVNEDLRMRVAKTLESRRLAAENRELKAQLSDKYDFSHVIGRSDAMKKVFSLLEKAIPASSNILITGETGTGKGLVAKTIHYNSPRKDRPFVAVNCGAIPEHLLESQLFGHKRGAFTSADRDAKGVVEGAEGGTLFLDEIGEMPLGLQVKILKLIQDREYLPVGGTAPVSLDARIIAATNQDLEKLISEGRFRQDLYYRLNVLEIEMPPLRARGDDSLFLAREFVKEFGKAAGGKVTGMDKSVERVIVNYPWPGNIRELRNVVERALVLCDGCTITSEHLPERFSQAGPGGRINPHLKEAHEEFESRYIQRICEENAGDKELTAKILGIDLATLYRKIKKYDIGC